MRGTSLGAPSLVLPALAADEALDSTVLSFLLNCALDEKEKEEERREREEEQRKKEEKPPVPVRSNYLLGEAYRGEGHPLTPSWVPFSTSPLDFPENKQSLFSGFHVAHWSWWALLCRDGRPRERLSLCSGFHVAHCS